MNLYVDRIIYPKPVDAAHLFAQFKIIIAWDCIVGGGAKLKVGCVIRGTSSLGHAYPLSCTGVIPR